MMQLPKPPPVSGRGTAEQLEGLRNYLSTVIDQVNMALQDIDRSLATLEGRDKNANRVTTTQALIRQTIAQSGQDLGWKYTFYKNGAYTMEKTVQVFPRYGATINKNGVNMYVSQALYEGLPFNIPGEVTGEDLTTHYKVTGSIVNGVLSYYVKSLAYFSGEVHTVKLKISGMIEDPDDLFNPTDGGDPE
jgi:hypothetical protein